LKAVQLTVCRYHQSDNVNLLVLNIQVKQNLQIKSLTVFYFFVKLPTMNIELEKKLTRCPRLGHEITLAYCLKESLDLPCSRILHCWSPVFNIETALQEELSAENWQKFINSQPEDKIINIIELIEAAKARK
jgi:hypothetical protein